MAAAELAADARARRHAEGLELASALTKVARLAGGCEPEAMPASALIGGAELEPRVRRLLDPPVQSRPPRFAWASCSFVGCSRRNNSDDLCARGVHELFELLVRR